MSSVLQTGDLSVIYAADNDVFGDAEDADFDYNELHFGADTVFAPGNAFAYSTNTATLVEGYDPGSQDTMSLTGTNFLGMSGTITHGEFVGDDTGGIIFDGTLNWNTTDGITGGKLSKFDITAVDGSHLVAEGMFNMKDDGSITGTVRKETVTTASGLIAEIEGAFSLTAQTGTLTKIYVHDGSGNGITFSGTFQAQAFFHTISTSATLGDVFAFGMGGKDVVTGDTGNDILMGFALDDTLKGLDGNDTLDGGTGRDLMTGGTGDDLYIVDNAGDKTVEKAGEGTDTVRSSIQNYTLAANIENMELSGGNINGTGNADVNTITGTDGNNTLDGGGGNDILIGGKGNDVYIFDNLSDNAVENAGEGTDTIVFAFDNTGPALVIPVALFSEIENLTVTGAGLFDLTGDANDNTLTGNAAVNNLSGGNGNDVLDGGLGADNMDGGIGNDTFHIDNAGDVIVDAGGIDTVVYHFAAGTFTLAADMENLVLAGTGSTNGVGNAAVNSLTGNAGRNTLDGMAGADVMAGLGGNDTYFVDDSSDTVAEGANGGFDIVQSSASFALGANVEALVLTGVGNINGTGNAAANTITGNAGNNMLDGGGATDKLIGGLGDDTYTVDLVKSGNVAKLQDVITEATGGGTDTLVLRAGALGLVKATTLVLSGNLENYDAGLTGTNLLNLTGNKSANTLTGNDGANVLKGLDGDDLLLGGIGNDTLDGGIGMDTLNGGPGADTFLFHAKDAASAANADTVIGFTAGPGGDVLDFHELLTGYHGGSLAGFVQLVELGGDTIISVDKDGPAGAAPMVQVVTLTGVTGLDADQMVIDGNLLVS